MCEGTAARKSLFPAMVNGALPPQKSKWAQGSLTDTLCYYTACVQGGKATTIGHILVVYFKCFMLQKEKNM